MKSFVAIFALVALAAADVSHLKSAEADAQILKQEADVLPDQYQYSYETSNGIQAQESGVLTNVGTDAEAIAVQGQNAYTAPGGERISVSYTADANGYQVQGSHLPTPPPIPEVILRSLEYIRTHPPKEARL